MSEDLMRVAKFLEKSEYCFKCHSEVNIIQLQLRCANGCFEIYFQIQSDFMLTVSATPRLLVPEGARREIALAINHANLNLRCGNFEISMDSGDLWYRFKIPLMDTFPSDTMLAFAITAASTLTDRYLPAFLAIIYGNEPAKDAIASAENALASRQAS